MLREDDPGAERLEVARLERLHGGGGADRHEDRRLDGAAGGRRAGRGGRRRPRRGARSGSRARVSPARAGGCQATARGDASPSRRPSAASRSGDACTPGAPGAPLADQPEPHGPLRASARLGPADDRPGTAARRRPDPSFSVTTSPTSGSGPGQRTRAAALRDVERGGGSKRAPPCSSASLRSRRPRSAASAPGRSPALRGRPSARNPAAGEAGRIERELDAGREGRAAHASDRRDLAVDAWRGWPGRRSPPATAT